MGRASRKKERRALQTNVNPTRFVAQEISLCPLARGQSAVVLGGIATLAVVGGWIAMFPVLWRFDRFPDRPPD